MAADRPPGSECGRATTDWEAAFLYYVALPAEQRDYRRVAEQFRVSARTVERHGGRERWKQRAREHDQAAAAAAAAQLGTKRTQDLVDLTKLIDASHVSYATQLRDGKVRHTVADLARLDKLRRQLWADADAALIETSEPAEPPDPSEASERKLQVLRALYEAGALGELLHRLPHVGRAEDDPQPKPTVAKQEHEPETTPKVRDDQADRPEHGGPGRHRDQEGSTDEKETN